MRNLLLVAKREYLEQIRGRAFRITTILVPALFAGIFFVAILSGRNSGVGKHVVIAAPSAELANAVRDEMMKDKDAKTTVDVVAPAAPADRDALVQKVQSKAVDGMLWIETSGGSTKATYTSQSSGDIVVTSRLAGALNHAIAMQRMTARGMSPAEVDALLKDVSVDTLQLDKQGKEVKSSGMISYLKGYIMALMLSMTTMIYGMNVARSIIQEKTSRIFEVMLAAAKPSDLLAGKLIGVGAVGLTQIAIWVLAGAAIVSAVASRAMMSGQITVHFSWVEAVLFRDLLRAGLPALCLAVRGARLLLRDRAGTADVHAAGCAAHLAELLAHLAGDQRSRIPSGPSVRRSSRPPRPSS